MTDVFIEGDVMSSKKAAFESKDPSHVAGNTPEPPHEDGVISSKKASFTSSDPSDLTIDPIDTLTVEDSASPEKSSFYARDPGLGTTDVSEETKKKYMGVERRRENRRKTQDRRGDVRFDLNKTDRRKSEGRREDDHTPKFW
jgi:hypothetical protein